MNQNIGSRARTAKRDVARCKKYEKRREKSSGEETGLRVSGIYLAGYKIFGARGASLHRAAMKGQMCSGRRNEAEEMGERV
jgi:hypothetical protein